jgi:hypothetical protein
MNRSCTSVRFFRRQLAVIFLDVEARILERPFDLVDRLYGRTVGDPGTRRLAHHTGQPLELFRVACRVHDLEAKVLAKYSAVQDLHFRTIELLADVVDDLGRRGRRQGQHRRIAEPPQGFADLEERGAEIVPPLRDAMGLVDDDEVDRLARERLEKLAAREPLRRGENEIAVLAFDGFERLLLLARGDGAVEICGFDADVVELVRLVLHQRDERRHDDRHPVEVQPRQLVTQRFTAAGRHYRQHVLAAHHVLDDLALSRPQFFEPENFAERPVDLPSFPRVHT